MSAKVEISISIILDPDDDGNPGISSDAETVHEATFYVTSGSVDDVMSAAEDALDEAKRACYQRALAPVPT